MAQAHAKPTNHWTIGSKINTISPLLKLVFQACMPNYGYVAQLVRAQHS